MTTLAAVLAALRAMHIVAVESPLTSHLAASTRASLPLTAPSAQLASATAVQAANPVLAAHALLAHSQYLPY